MKNDFRVCEPIHKAAVVKQAYLHKETIFEFAASSRAADELRNMISKL